MTELIPRLVPVVFGFTLAVTLGLAIYGSVRRKARLEKFAEFALANGFTSHRHGIPASEGAGLFGLFHEPTPLIRLLCGSDPLAPGKWPVITMHMTGQQGEVLWDIFDFERSTERTTSDGRRQKSTQYFTVVSASLPMNFPVVEIRPENFLDRVAQVFGSKDLNFELEEFNRRYVVRSEEEHLAYGILHPQMIEYLMKTPARHWQIGAHQVLIASQGNADILEVQRTMADMEGFLQRLPPYLREDLGARR